MRVHCLPRRPIKIHVALLQHPLTTVVAAVASGISIIGYLRARARARVRALIFREAAAGRVVSIIVGSRCVWHRRCVVVAVVCSVLRHLMKLQTAILDLHARRRL